MEPWQRPPGPKRRKNILKNHNNHNNQRPTFPMRKLGIHIILLTTTACHQAKKHFPEPLPNDTTTLSNITAYPALADSATIDSTIKETTNSDIDTRNVSPQSIVTFAQTLKGIPYKYASSDPRQGFDCSGFITYVFNHFNIRVPRSSIDFTNVGREVPPSDARPGDLILFTGTDSTVRIVGHMGIVISPPGNDVSFIHSSSGKAYGVTVNPLKGYYETRFVKVVRVFPE
jgi:cell wall-associated NlpC family hydrolase